MDSAGHPDKLGKEAVGSWTSVIPCTLDGSPCNNCFASPKKENVHDHAQSRPSPGSHDYELRKIDVAQVCSRKVFDVSHAETSNHVANRDALHVLASGKLLKGAFMEDMRDSPEKLEKGTPSGNTAGMHSLPQLMQGGGVYIFGPNVVGPKKKKSAKISKKATADITSPTAKGKGGLKRKRNRANGRKGSKQLSRVSLKDSNIENMNRVILEKMKIEEATAIWDIGK
ncbi:hypothetical protein Ancab_000875 [Ancistrocladus abbreviatus]